MTTFGRRRSDYDRGKTDIPLFNNVVYRFDSALSSSKQEKLKTLLNENGATHFDESDMEVDDADAPTESSVTHLICARDPFVNSEEDAVENQSDKLPFIVKPSWVEVAVENGFVHEEKYHSPRSDKFFSGTVVTCTGLPKNDQEVIYGCTLAVGGQYRLDLERDVTHLVALAPHGAMYEKAIQNSKIKVVLPHYFEECFRLRRRVREDLYLFPNPPMFAETSSPKKEEIQTQNPESCGNDLIHSFPSSNATFPAPKEKFLKGHCIYFDSDITIKPESREQVATALQEAGAKVADTYGPEVTVAIVKFRGSDTYLKASKDNKEVASLWWVYNTLARGRYESPLTTLVDYPSPNGGVPGMQNYVITVSGYRGVARDFLRRIVIALGATFTPNYNAAVTHLIAMSKHSPKYRTARHNRKVVVNHLWLEECFQTWSDLPPSDDRYVHFPGAEILSEIVGQTRLEKENVDMWRHDAEKLPDVVPLNPQSSRGIVSFSDFDRGSVRPAPAAPNQALKSPSDKGVQVHRPRQAAVEASQNLQDVFVPDMNAYQKEKSKAPARRSRELSMEPKGKRKRSVSPENLGDVEMKEATKPVQKRSREGSAKESSPAKEPSEGLLDKDVEEASKPEEQSKGEDHEEAKSTITHPKIATTGIELKGDEKSGIRRLGGQITNNITAADFLIVEDHVLRTTKFLCAVNLGIPILTVQWLHHSLAKHEWIANTEAYLIKDDEAESKFKFQLSESLTVARSQLVQPRRGASHGTWLEDYEVIILQPNKVALLKDVIETAGGKVANKASTARRLKEATASDTQPQLLVLSSPQEKDKWAEYEKKGIVIYDIELVIVGALRQRLNPDEFRLN